MKSKKILIIALAFLLASLALNIYFYTLTRNYYIQLNSLRLAPWGWCIPPEIFQPRQQTTHSLSFSVTRVLTSG